MLWLALLSLLSLASAEDDVVVCGGFIKSSSKLPFSEVKIGVFSSDGILKDTTECAPHNGYFLLPLYAKGPISIKVLPPTGWSFEPAEVKLNVDGTDKCSKSEDINFIFTGFTVSGTVVSTGLTVGPSGVTVTMTNAAGAQYHAVTKDGAYSLGQILSGEYTLSVSHPQWKVENPSQLVTVGVDNVQVAEPFVVVSYDVRGRVESSGQPIAGVELYLTPTIKAAAAIDGCEAASTGPGQCKVVSDSNGDFVFPALAPGEYTVVPHYQSEQSRFDVSPSDIVFTVTIDTVVLDTVFTVNGFAVTGRVLSGLEGVLLSGADVFVNGKKVFTTLEDGLFELSNVTSGDYVIDAKKKGYYFEAQTLAISPNNPTMPDIVANAYQLCGHVVMPSPPSMALPLGQRKVALQPAGEGGNADAVTTVTDGSGHFCFKVSNGLYTLQCLVSMTEHKGGLRLSPDSAEVQVAGAPLEGATFTQLLASVTGTVECISSPCSPIAVTLTGPDGTLHKTVTEEGVWTVSDILPGTYTAQVLNPAWCWRESELTVEVDVTGSTADTFVQSGYILNVEVSHEAQLNFTQEEGEVGSYSLTSGTNRFCLKKPGMYKLRPYACHKFEQDTYTYSTQSPAELKLQAVSHLVTGKILSLTTDIPISIIITNLDTHEKQTVDATLTEETEGEFTVFSFQYWGGTNEKFIIKPLSDKLLFVPSTQSTEVSDTECPTEIPMFHGRPGIFVSGVIEPSVSGALVTLITPDNPELKLTQVTDDNGGYSIGPLHSNLNYEVSAAKDGYNIHKTAGHNFVATKLSKLTVNVGEENGGTLSGVLVSVSGGEGYRSNILLQDVPLVLTGLVPGDYYIRPIMKEFQFTPSSKMLSISEGEEMNIDMVAVRVAFSCYGRVTSLNGRPEKGAIVEAVGAGACALQEEGITDAEGYYRIRGIRPNCPVTITVRTDKLEHLRRSTPGSRVVTGDKVDVKDVNFIVFHEPTTFDITGFVDVPEEFVSTVKVVLIEENAGGRVIHSQPLSHSRIFIFPDMALKATYTVRVESSLSTAQYKYRQPERKIDSNAPFQHLDILLNPVKKAAPAEPTPRGGAFTALAVIVLSFVLFLNHATLVPVFTQVFMSVINRGQADSVSPGTGGTGSDNGMEYVDDIHRGTRRKVTSKKR